MKLALPALLAYAFCSAGCGHDAHDHDGEHDHSHTHVAPNGGTLVELGDHFANVEFVLDDATGLIRMYVLGGHADESVRTSQSRADLVVSLAGGEPFDVKLEHVASELSGETVGDSSLYEGAHEDLVGAVEFEGRIRELVVMGETFTDVSFTVPAVGHDEHGEAAHDEDDHQHGDDEDAGHDEDAEHASDHE